MRILSILNSEDFKNFKRNGMCVYVCIFIDIFIYVGYIDKMCVLF